jgi:hypothetical protein
MNSHSSGGGDESPNFDPSVAEASLDLLQRSSSSSAAAASAAAASLRPQIPAQQALTKSQHRRSTDDTASADGSVYEVIEYDLHDRTNNNTASFLDTSSGPLFPESLFIEDNSPAAAALRANASVKVSRTGKVARAVHIQAVRKIVKRATGTTKSGVTRGKPPRLPPTIQENGGVDAQQQQHHSLEPIDETTTGGGDADCDDAATDPNSDPRILMQRQDSHIPEGVVAGTVEAGNRGRWLGRSSSRQKAIYRIVSYHFLNIYLRDLGGYFSFGSGRHA